jgi:hypothetical protein
MRWLVVLAGLFGPLAASLPARAEPRTVILECTVPQDLGSGDVVAVPLSCRVRGQGPLVAVAIVRPGMLLAWETLDPFDGATARVIETSDPFERSLPGYVDPFERGRFARMRTEGELVDPFARPPQDTPDVSADPDSQVFP